MRATVMESKNGKAVILTEDGMFRTVNGNYNVGWEFDYKVPVSRNRKMTSRIAAAAACLFMMLSMGTYSYQNLMVYATVTLHGTAPIQLELNRHDKVIGVKAIDESGEALAEQLLDSGIKGENLEDAVAKAEQMMKAQKDNSKAAMLPQVQCKSSDKVKKLTDMLRQEEQTGSQTAAPSTEPSTAATPSATAGSEEKPEVSVQGETTEEETTATTTQPSSSDEMTSQEGQQDEMTSQESTDMTAQEAPAASEAPAPADEPAPVDEPNDNEVNNEI